jgi:hypothetical protein
MPVLPHYLQGTSSASREADSPMFSDYGLRLGEVIEVIHTDDDRNNTELPRQTQYRVRAQRREGKGKSVTQDYLCVVADTFGGIGDRFRATRRKATKVNTDTITNGSRVLLLCLNAHTGSGVIIGGLKNRKATQDPGKDAGDNLVFEFNGVHIDINNDGELSLVTPGPTDTDGQPRDRDPANQGTTITLKKNGSVKVENKSGEVIEIDTPNRKINMTSKNQTGSTEESWKLTAGQNFTVDAGQQARMGGDTIKIGSEGASENLVLGKKLAEALRSLVNDVVLPNSSTWSMAMGLPTPIHPKALASFQTWMSKYLSGATPPILAEKKFTER